MNNIIWTIITVILSLLLILFIIGSFKNKHKVFIIIVILILMSIKRNFLFIISNIKMKIFPKVEK